MGSGPFIPNGLGVYTLSVLARGWAHQEALSLDIHFAVHTKAGISCLCHVNCIGSVSSTPQAYSDNTKGKICQQFYVQHSRFQGNTLLVSLSPDPILKEVKTMRHGRPFNQERWCLYLSCYALYALYRWRHGSAWVPEGCQAAPCGACDCWAGAHSQGKTLTLNQYPNP